MGKAILKTTILPALGVILILGGAGVGNAQVSQYMPPPDQMLGGLNQELFGPGGQPQEAQQQEPIIYVKVGTKIFDAVEPHVLLHYDVDIIPLRVSQYDPKEYFDDGINGGDEIPNDGMPSKIIINNSQYMSIYSARNRDRINAHKQQMVQSGPVKFFRLPATTPDAYVAANATDDTARRELERFSATYWKDRISSKVDDIDNQELARYEGFEVFSIYDAGSGMVFFDTTRTPEEVEDILDGRARQREEALMRREEQRDRLAESRDMRTMRYGGNSPTDTYMRRALDAAGAANTRIQGAEGMYDPYGMGPYGGQQGFQTDRSTRTRNQGTRQRGGTQRQRTPRTTGYGPGM